MEKKRRIFVMSCPGPKPEPGQETTYWQTNASLTPDGKNRVENVCQRYLAEIDFELLMCSTLTRAVQAAIVVANASLSHVNKSEKLGPISEDAWDLWQSLDPRSVRGKIGEMFESSGGGPLLITEGESLYAFLKNKAAAIENGQNIFMVSHYPLIECAIARAMHKWPPRFTLAAGGIVVFCFDDGKSFLEWEYLPPP